LIILYKWLRYAILKVCAIIENWVLWLRLRNNISRVEERSLVIEIDSSCRFKLIGSFLIVKPVTNLWSIPSVFFVWCVVSLLRFISGASNHFIVDFIYELYLLSLFVWHSFKLLWVTQSVLSIRVWSLNWGLVLSEMSAIFSWRKRRMIKVRVCCQSIMIVGWLRFYRLLRSVRALIINPVFLEDLELIS
jgi:hypothetical protein